MNPKLKSYYKTLVTKQKSWKINTAFLNNNEFSIQSNEDMITLDGIRICLIRYLKMEIVFKLIKLKQKVKVQKISKHLQQR